MYQAAETLPLVIVSATVEGRWQPGLGDPSLMGWVTTASYAAAALLCLRRAWISYGDPALRRKPCWFWTVCGLIMLALCINKQLDLQTLFTDIGRQWAQAGGWYDERRTVQSLFIKGLGIAGVGGFLFALWFIRGARPHYYTALIGLTFTGCFVMVRAASIHHVDRFIGLDIAGVKMNWVFELGGIIVVAASALVADTSSASQAAAAARAASRNASRPG